MCRSLEGGEGEALWGGHYLVACQLARQVESVAADNLPEPNIGSKRENWSDNGKQRSTKSCMRGDSMKNEGDNRRRSKADEQL